MIDEKQISDIVKKVMADMDINQASKRKQLGVFDTMEEAIEACNKAYEIFRY